MSGMTCEDKIKNEYIKLIKEMCINEGMRHKGKLKKILKVHAIIMADISALCESY